MALFKRTKKDSVLPEVDKYYEGERRDRAGLAWLLALVSVAVVALVLVGLFLGGRWVYRQVANNDDSNEVAVTNDEEVEAPSFDGGSTAPEQSSEGSEDEAAGDDAEETSDSTNGNSSNADEEEGTVEAPARTDVPSTGDSGELPGTGPAGVAGVFMGVSTLAGGIHYIVERRKLNR